MAKLLGVNVIDMQDGEITKVSYQGEEYTKVGGAPKAGDVMYETTGGPGVTSGAYYVVNALDADDDPRFIDDDGAFNGVFLKKSGITPNAYYRKSTATVSAPFAEMITSKIDAVEERVSALEDARDVVSTGYPYTVITELRENSSGQIGTYTSYVYNTPPTFSEGDRVKALRDGEDSEIEAGKYGVVESTGWGNSEDPYAICVDSVVSFDYFRPQDLELVAEVEALKVGDYAVIIQSAYHLIRYKVGDIVPVVEISSDGFPIVLAKGHARERMNPVQVRKATQAEIGEATKPVVGDIVVITANTYASRNKVGDIGKVVEATYNSGVMAKVEVLDKPATPEVNDNYTRYNEMRHATPAEDERYHEAVKQLAKDAIFTKAGRKPNEYRKGDLVRVTRELGESITPVLGVIEDDYNPNYGVRISDDYLVVYLGDTEGEDGEMEIVCFAEDRKDAVTKGGR